MSPRVAQCACGALRVETRGEPARVSVCHCLGCRRRTGSVFGAQARFRNEDVAVSGVSRVHRRRGDSGGESEMHFCGTCGTTVFWRVASVPEFTYVAIGAFADPAFPPPTVEVYDERRSPWVEITGVSERE